MRYGVYSNRLQAGFGWLWDDQTRSLIPWAGVAEACLTTCHGANRRRPLRLFFDRRLVDCVGRESRLGFQDSPHPRPTPERAIDMKTIRNVLSALVGSINFRYFDAGVDDHGEFDRSLRPVGPHFSRLPCRHRTGYSYSTGARSRVGSTAFSAQMIS